MTVSVTVTKGELRYDHTTAGLNNEDVPVEVESQRQVYDTHLEGEDYLLINVLGPDDRIITVNIHCGIHGRADVSISG